MDVYACEFCHDFKADYATVEAHERTCEGNTTAAALAAAELVATEVPAPRRGALVCTVGRLRPPAPGPGQAEAELIRAEIAHSVCSSSPFVFIFLPHPSSASFIPSRSSPPAHPPWLVLFHHPPYAVRVAEQRLIRGTPQEASEASLLAADMLDAELALEVG